MMDSPSSAHSGSSHGKRRKSQDNFNLESLSANHGSRNDDPLGTLKSSEPAPEKSHSNEKKKIEDEIDMKYKSFKQFDIVLDHSDHHFRNGQRGVEKNWAKRIQYEWKILEKDLPETIYVRAYEDRMDLLRAVMIGAAGTPYHDGLFFFDIFFPPTYPYQPPLVHYHSGGLSINPNLKSSGEVCLSLLNTWSGRGPSEMWMPSASTILQVLVSIQGLVLNAKPYFNEPMLVHLANSHRGEMMSLAFNENVLLLSCTTMLYSMRRPPKHFEDFVAGHFRERGPAILAACFAYLNGARVGCADGGVVGGGGESTESHKPGFESLLSELFDDLLDEFTTRGADCDEMAAQKPKHRTTNGGGRRRRRARNGAADAESYGFPLQFPNDIYHSTPFISPQQRLLPWTPLTGQSLPPPRMPIPDLSRLTRHPGALPAAPVWFSADPLRISSAPVLPRISVTYGFSAPPPPPPPPQPQQQQPSSGWQSHYPIPFSSDPYVGLEQLVAPPLPLWLPLPPPPRSSTGSQQRPSTQPHARFPYPSTTADTYFYP